MKSKPDYKKQIKIIVSKVLNIDIKKISDKSGPNVLDKWDSLNHLNIILACEEYFKVSFSNSELIEMLDIDTINEIIKEKIQ